MKPILKYYSNAKFLITGEYLVLNGALSLAVPLKFGQLLEVYPSNGSDLEWIALEKGEDWLRFSISELDIQMAKNADNDEKDFVCFLLNRARYLNPNFLRKLSYQIKTEIDFNRNWGLGSSSSLINNVALWANVNPFELHELVSNGSGYDIACANYCKPILFRKNGLYPLIYPVDFNPDFTKDLYFVYLGKKQNSSASVRKYLGESHVNSDQIDHISSLSKQIVKTIKSDDFDAILLEHENTVAEVLNCKTVKNDRFSDFSGSVKSLGAWGGDFVLVRSNIDKKDLYRYFLGKGLDTIFPWNDIILNSN